MAIRLLQFYTFVFRTVKNTKVSKCKNVECERCDNKLCELFIEIYQTVTSFIGML